MGKKGGTVLPTCKSDIELAEQFNKFFINKISSIRDVLSGSNQSVDSETACMSSDIEFSGEHFSEFAPVSDRELLKIINSAPTKSCELDPLPTFLLKQCVEPLLPLISAIINKSLSDSKVPHYFKAAIIRPLLKKPGLDKEILKNYRPVSNLPFLSKILEKVVASRLENHLTHHSLLDNQQSAYRPVHSTETALLSTP